MALTVQIAKRDSNHQFVYTCACNLLLPYLIQNLSSSMILLQLSKTVHECLVNSEEAIRITYRDIFTTAFQFVQYCFIDISLKNVFDYLEKRTVFQQSCCRTTSWLTYIYVINVLWSTQRLDVCCFRNVVLPDKPHTVPVHHECTCGQRCILLDDKAYLYPGLRTKFMYTS